jgi:hypothetical protein
MLITACGMEVKMFLDRIEQIKAELSPVRKAA